LIEVVADAGLPAGRVDFEDIVRVFLFQATVDVLEVHLVGWRRFKEVVDEELVAVFGFLELLWRVVGFLAVVWRRGSFFLGR
jgi:hypothetical protein